MFEKLPVLLDWIEDVNKDIIEDEVVPNVTLNEFKKLKEFFSNPNNIEFLKNTLKNQ